MNKKLKQILTSLIICSALNLSNCASNFFDKFSLVEQGVYRSAQPRKQDLRYLREIGIRKIIYLFDEAEIPDYERKFAEENGIEVLLFPIDGKKPNEERIAEIVRDVLNAEKNNVTILYHCKGGRHRTGMVTAIIRRLEGKSLDYILEEYRSYCDFLPNQQPRKENENFIRNFDLNLIDR